MADSDTNDAILSDSDYQERIMDEGYAVSPTEISNWKDNVEDDRERVFLELSEAMEQEMKEKVSKDDGDIPGYISNEIYKSVSRYETNNTTEDKKDDKVTILDLKLSEIIKNTSECLKNFMSEYNKALHLADVENIDGKRGILYTIRRYIIAFFIYLNDKDNMLYTGITLLIISIILYSINIIRR